MLVHQQEVYWRNPVSTVDFITIASQGNAIDYADLKQ